MIIQAISNYVVNVISSMGYVGVAFLMGIESAAIPLPSEIIMPFAGYLVSTGRFTLWGIALAGGIGSMIGSLVLYYIGYFGGRPLIEKYGKYILIHTRDLERSDRFFARYGEMSNFFGRMLPVIRTFISFPAGVARMPVVKFAFHSFAGSFIWSLFLGWVGLKLGQNWVTLREKLHGLDIMIIVVIILAVAYYIYKHRKGNAHQPPQG